ITLRSVPLQLIFPDGISWVVSQIGHPLTSYVCDGLDVKLCVVLGAGVTCPESVSVLLDDDECVEIHVSSVTTRTYDKPVATWRNKVIPLDEVVP
ncbi:hypothetical protein LINGRAHAP2_LOCUS23160, partial [Linum grandiflorum]